jgi:glycosyltransferase involved in cell wall biosynthesis
LVLFDCDNKTSGNVISVVIILNRSKKWMKNKMYQNKSTYNKLVKRMLPMRILYDHQIFYRQNYGGVSRYFCELMNQFSTDPEINFTLPLHFVQNDNLAQFPQLNENWSGRYNRLYNNNFLSVLQKKIRFNALNFGLNFLIDNRGESIRLLKKQDFDIFHPTYYEPYFLKYLEKKPYILTVYDMIHEHFPNYFKTSDQTIKWKKQLIENAGGIIAISENTKQDILKFTNADPDRIRVIYLGNPFEHTGSPAKNNLSREFPVFEKPYILFVGDRRTYKNFIFLIESLADKVRNNNGLHIVCAGSLPFTGEEKKLFKNLNIVNKVHHVKINDAILKNLYNHARAFIFPSLYEGFGLPILEAFSCGCPAIVSRSSSLPEIGGDGAIYFEPSEKESIILALETILSNETYREELIKKGYNRLKFFSWEKTADSTKKVYNNVLDR